MSTEQSQPESQSQQQQEGEVPISLNEVAKIRVQQRNENTLKLSKLSNDTAYNNLAKLISTTEYPDNGITYKARVLTHKEVGALKKLDRESRTINQEEDWDAYTNNIKEQAKILIQDFTDEQFDRADFTLIENLVVAWSMKPGGFRVF